MKDKKTVQYIKRKSLMYKTDVEYGDYSLNHVLGCSHGCMYPCYAMMMAKRFGRVKLWKEKKWSYREFLYYWFLPEVRLAWLSNIREYPERKGDPAERRRLVAAALG